MKQLSPDTQAVLLLCGRFGERNGADPLTPGEYGRLVQWLKSRSMQPAELLEHGPSADIVEAKLESARIESLFGRGAAMALATEKWLRSGLWIVSQSDESYPRRLKTTLGQDAPALLFGAGDATLLDAGGLAIVGSRDASELELDFARDVAARCAKDGIAVVSGGARGVDAAAMQGAGEGGGRVIGVLVDSLLRASVNRDNRRGIEEGRLVLVSSFHPEAGFHAGNAMQRNRYIYALSDYALVVQSDLEKGGTWAGAKENLKAGWVPLFVRDDPASPGIRGLIKRGARIYAPGSGNLASALADGMPEPRKEPELFAPASAQLVPAEYVVEEAGIAAEHPEIFEQGETVAATQTSEEIRQRFRKALGRDREQIVNLPWKAGAGIRKGMKRGVVFCAEVGKRVYLRFVPGSPDWHPLRDPALVIGELGTCLRLIECSKDTPSAIPAALHKTIVDFWNVARDHVFCAWRAETAPATTQPKVRPLNRKVAKFLRTNIPQDMDAQRIDRALEILESPWPRHEELMLRKRFQDMTLAPKEKAQRIIELVERSGLGLFLAPKRLPPILANDIHLDGWIALEPES